MKNTEQVNTFNYLTCVLLLRSDVDARRKFEICTFT